MKRDGFSTKMGAIAAAAGSAVGLGNIWRFPYVLGENGGAAFMLLYIFFTLVIALPVMMSEFAIGRMTGKPVTAAYMELAPRKKWYFIGLSGVFCAFIILSFYNVVSGWTMYYTYMSVTGDLVGLTEGEIGSLFSRISSDPVECMVWMLLFLIVTAVVVARGVEKGIEKYSKILMPLMLVLIVAMCVRAVTLDGAAEGVSFLLKPDFSKLSANAIFIALGQSFFSLSIGMGVMTTYGAYISRKENLSADATSVAMIDFFIAFMAGLIIFPCAFAFGINPGQGPGLVFVTLPNIFNQMFMGQIVSIVFFTLLVVAALTSSISLLEVQVSFLESQFGMKRKKATAILASIVAALSVCCSMSGTLFNFFDSLSANVLMPLGAFFIVISVQVVVGRDRMRAELESHGKRFRLFPLFYFLIQYIVPVAILLVFLNCVLSWCGVDIFG